MFDENFGEICRLCLKQEAGMLSIFEIPWIDANSILAEKITFVAPVQIESDDGLPASICGHCREQVDRFYDFRVLVEVSDRTLRSNLHHSQSNESKVRVEPEESDFLTQHGNGPFVRNDFLSVDAIVLPTENGVQVWKISASSKDQRSLGSFKAEADESHRDLTEEALRIDAVQCLEDDQQEIEYADYSKEDKIICQLCLQTFLSLPDLKSHIAEHLAVSDTDASRANERKKTEDTANTTWETLGREEEDVQIENCPGSTLSCVKCKNVFATDEEYDLHMKMYVCEPHKCSFCSRTFVRFACRKLHEQIHTQEKKHVCSDCDKVFLKRSELRYHKGTHVGVPQICTICDKHFQTTQSFKIHMKRHTLGTRYICEVCGKNYYTNSELSRHVQTHSGLREHPCGICDMSFFSKPELNRHLKYHTGEKKFKCNVCFKSYFESGHLKIHERVHTGERPFLCTFCGKTFISRSKLLRHKKIHSKDDINIERSQ